MLPAGIVLGDARQVEGDSGEKYFEFLLGLDRPSTKAVTVQYGTQDGTATTDDGDYQAVVGTLTWAAGDNAMQTIRVPVLGDGRFEMEEDFYLILTDATNAALRKDIGRGLIMNDDAFTYSAPADAGPNALTLLVDGENVELLRGEESVLQGTLAESAPLTVVGAAGVETTLTVDVVGGTPAAGRILFQGSPDGTDRLIVLDSAARR